MNVGDPPASSERAAFISYASADADKATEVCQHLEAAGLRCWIAPRDLRPGSEYGDEIIRGIMNSQCLVLILSEAANKSVFVRREVERAVSKGKPVIPFRIESVLPSPQLELFVSSSQWIDAWTGPMVKSLRRLEEGLRGGALHSPATTAITTQLSKPRWIAAGIAVAIVALLVAGYMIARTSGLIGTSARVADATAVPLAATLPNDAPASYELPTGRWSGTLNCGGRIGLDVMVNKVRDGRVLGYMSTYGVGGRRVPQDCRPMLGTLDADTGEMSLRAQVAGRPQSVANVDGFRGIILNGHMAGDRFSGSVDYLASCSSFVLMRSGQEIGVPELCEKVPRPNPYAGLPTDDLLKRREAIWKLALANTARNQKAAASKEDVKTCSAAAIDGWSAEAYLRWVGEWVKKHPEPSAAATTKQRIGWQVALANEIRSRESYDAPDWRALPCRDRLIEAATATAARGLHLLDELNAVDRAGMRLP